MFVYVLRNKKNGKCYVGQDSGSVEELTRVNAHFNTLKSFLRGKPLKGESKLIPALAKYGIENFEVEIASRGHTSKTELDDAEIALIAKLNCIKNGYNILPGGQGMPSNAMVSDPDVLAALYEIRARGAKASNEKRWGSATDEDRQKIWQAMRDGRLDGNWQKNVQAAWDRLSVEERSARGHQMKEGKRFRYVLLKDEKTIVETNLRALLAHVEQPPVSKKTIESIVRNENHFICPEFKIEKREHRRD